VGPFPPLVLEASQDRVRENGQTAHPMSAASVYPQSAADCLIRSAVDISHPRQQGNPPASLSADSGPVRSDIINGLGAGAVGGLAILRWFLACLQASFPVFFTLFLPLRRRALVTTCLRKVIVGALVTWAIYTHLGYLYSCYDQA